MMTTSKPSHDPVKSPAYYTAYPVQPIEITRHLGFCLGNAVKYVLRAPFKGGVEDCKKALQYLEWEREPLNFAGAKEYGYPFKPCFGAYQEICRNIDELRAFMLHPDRESSYFWQSKFLDALKVYLRGIWREKGDGDRLKALRAFGDMKQAVVEMIEEANCYGQN